jgi:hypothetical protein
MMAYKKAMTDTKQSPIPERFCRILEPDNPDYSERFQCKDCGENFITLCDAKRLKAKITALEAQLSDARRGIESVQGINAALEAANREQADRLETLQTASTLSAESFLAAIGYADSRPQTAPAIARLMADYSESQNQTLREEREQVGKHLLEAIEQRDEAKANYTRADEEAFRLREERDALIASVERYFVCSVHEDSSDQDNNYCWCGWRRDNPVHELAALNAKQIPPAAERLILSPEEARAADDGAKVVPPAAETPAPAKRGAERDLLLSNYREQRTDWTREMRGIKGDLANSQQQVARLTAALRAAHPFASEEMLNEIVSKVALSSPVTKAETEKI